MADERRVVKVAGQITIEDCVSSKGNAYRAVFVTIDGKKIQVGFLNAQTELAFIYAGVPLVPQNR